MTTRINRVSLYIPEHNTDNFKDKPHDDRMSQSSRKSTASVRSRRKTIEGTRGKSIEGFEYGDDSRLGKWLRLQEYLLLFIEASLSMTVFAIAQRNETRTPGSVRQLDIYMEYAEGYSTLLSMVIGVIADSWLRHYTLALFSVILHFIAICIVVMEEVVITNQQHNPYAPVVTEICIVGILLMRSTDFVRLVYGLAGMADRKKSTIFSFIFLQFWVSNYATYGGVFLNVGSGIFNYFKLDIVTLSFLLSGLSVFLFVYLLHPETHWKDNKGLGCGVVGCLLLATYYEIFKITKGRRRGFFTKTEGKCKKTTVSRTKKILFVYVLLLPTLGVAFFTSIRASLFYSNIFGRIKTGKQDNDGIKLLEIYGLQQFARAIVAIGMLVSNYIIWPLITLTGFGDKYSSKFLVGQFLTVLVLFYAAILMGKTEPLQYNPAGGYVWIYNTWGNTVRFISEDLHFTEHNFYVRPKAGEMLGYPCSRETLFAMTVDFSGSQKNFTSFLSVTPLKTTGFVILDPPEVMRIRGHIPLRQAPPGIREDLPRIFIYNTAKTLPGAKIRIRLAHKKKTLKQVVMHLGILTTITLEPARYEFSVLRADIREFATIHDGGLYGMIIHATTTSRKLEIYTVTSPNTASPLPSLIMCFLFGFSRGLVNPSLRAIIFYIAPDGLVAMSFAFLSSLEGLSLWITYIGFITWHPYVTASVLFIYAFFLSGFSVISTFVLIKYRASYD